MTDLNLNNEELTYQQLAVYERFSANLAAISQSSSEIASRASLVLGGSTVVFAAGGFAQADESTAALSIVLTVLSGFATLVLAIIAGSIWMPRDGKVPGPDNTDAFYEKYINENADDCYSQLLNDIEDAHAIEQGWNKSVSDRVWVMILIFDVQVLFSVVALCVR